MPGKNKHVAMRCIDPRPMTYHTKLVRDKFYEKYPLAETGLIWILQEKKQQQQHFCYRKLYVKQIWVLAINWIPLIHGPVFFAQQYSKHMFGLDVSL